jgi:hypothetical protein
MTHAQAHHKKDDGAHFTDHLHGARTRSGVVSPALCWPQGEAPAHAALLQPNYTASVAAAAAATGAGAALGATTPPIDGASAFTNQIRA